MEHTPRPRRLAGLVAVVALAALTVLSLWSVTPPAPLGADAPTDQFSAARAYAHVQRIGEHVHVAGSDAASEVRDYIITTLRSYGLDPQVQDAVGAESALGHGYSMAHVRNVVAVLSGTASTAPVFAVAHYDSVQVSYGANDDGAGVTSLLETARAMTQGGAARPRNDVVFVFTEAEEACLCGAEAFVSQHPLAAKGGVVLNVESRGSSGPAIMFETSVGNAGVVGVYGDAVPDPVATSFAVEVYRILPNDTDFTPFRKSGRFTGLNTAYIDGSAVYHSAEDRPSYMDTASLQHEGANLLAATRAFGNADLSTLDTPSADDVTYFPALGFLIRYPGWLVWPLAGLAVLVVVGLAVIARRRAATSLPRTLAGFGLTLIPLLLAPVAAQLLWTLLVAVRPGYANMIDPWRPGWYRAGVVALVAAIVFAWYGLLRRRIGAWALAIGSLAWLGVLGLVLAAATPGGSYLAALPALACGVAAAIALRVRSAWLRALALALGGVVSVLILAPTVLLFFPALGLATGGAAAFFAVLLALALLPLLESLYPAAAGGASISSTVDGKRRRGFLPGLVACVAAVACVATGLAVDRFDPTHPLPAELMYGLDTDTGQATWISTDVAPGDWTGHYVHAGATDISAVYPLLDGRKVLTGPATAADLPAPTLTLVSDTTTGSHRQVVVNLRSQRPVRLTYLRVDGAKVLSASVDGRQVTGDALTGAFSVLFHAPPADGLSISLELDHTGPTTFRVLDGSDGLDGLPGFSPRPAGVGIEGSHNTELVMVARTYHL